MQGHFELSVGKKGTTSLILILRRILQADPEMLSKESGKKVESDSLDSPVGTRSTVAGEGQVHTAWPVCMIQNKNKNHPKHIIRVAYKSMRK